MNANGRTSPKKTVEALAAKASLTIDYPQAGEIIVSPIYSVRLTAPEAERVDISIDGGPKQECRRASGHFWYDWSGYMSGQHEITAVAQIQGVDQSLPKPRRVKVEIPI